MKITMTCIMFLCLVSCGSGYLNPLDQIKKMPAHMLATHTRQIAPELSAKSQTADPSIIDYLNKMDSTTSYAAHQLTNDETRVLSEYLDYLPEEYQSLMREKLAVLYVIDNFAGGGMSDLAFDTDGAMYAVLYLNSRLFKDSLSEWIGERDQSMFLDDLPNITVRVDCGDKYLGLLHTLVHEASHIYDYYRHITPYVDLVLQEPGAGNDTAFVAKVWVDYTKPQSMYEYAERAGIWFYDLGQRTSESKAIGIYRQLRNTPFSSVYGSRTWAEDFAETFTWDYLEQKFGVGYRVQVIDAGQAVVVFDPADSPLVRQRRDLVASLVSFQSGLNHRD